jgi:hypothetical protein
MVSELKLWTSVGLAAFALASCAPAAPPQSTDGKDQSRELAEQAPATPAPQAGVGETGAGEGGAAGESGEGGVDTSQAATDPLVYLTALAVTEAHIRAAIDAHAAGETKAAAEMFAHPVSEVLADLEPALQTLGVANFDSALIDASAAVFSGEDTASIAKRGKGILDVLKAAQAKAPTTHADPLRVKALVIADQLARAARMYVTAAAGDSYEPYLDGYGFARTAEALYAPMRAQMVSQQPQAAAAIEGGLVLLRASYPTVTRPDPLNTDAASLASVASRIELGLQ